MKKILVIFIIISCYILNNFVYCQTINSSSSTDMLTFNKTITYIEDLANFDNKDQITQYFGEKNVKHSIELYYEGIETEITRIFPHHKKQIIIVWSYDDPKRINEIYNIKYGESQDTLAQGGLELPFKNGLHFKMTLSELEELNNGPFEFFDFKWSVAFMNIVGKVNTNTLDEPLKHYQIYLNYNIPELEDISDYDYLFQGRNLMSEDPKINPEMIYISRIIYNP